MDRTKCLRCGGQMVYVGREHLQKGKAGVFLGSWDNILSGALDVEVYVCRKCHKIDFYAAEGSDEEEPAGEDGAMARIPCPYCGKLHDLDDAVCPRCGKRLQEIDPYQKYR